jgi:hypothetical protein
MKIIDWINTNSGVVMSILTFVYVIATTIIAWLMLKANRLSNESILQTNKLEQQRVRPHLIFDFEISQSCVLATLVNLGATPAKNISVKISPELYDITQNGKRQSGITSSQIKFLAPKAKLTDFIAVGHQFYKQYETPNFTGTLSYEDYANNSYEEKFEIDLGYRKELIYISDPSTPKEVEKLRKELEKTNGHLKKIAANKSNN